jgi:hypothetical protein
MSILLKQPEAVPSSQLSFMNRLLFALILHA